jgi:hypothetical protein
MHCTDSRLIHKYTVSLLLFDLHTDDTFRNQKCRTNSFIKYGRRTIMIIFADDQVIIASAQGILQELPLYFIDY